MIQTSPSLWEASLSLTLSQTLRGTRLTKNEHTGPLYVQKPFYPEGKNHPHIYLLHPPGGLVSGDHLSIDIALEKNSAALFTAPGAARVYKARSDKTPQKQTVNLRLSEHSCAEWLPQESIFYPGGFSDVATRVYMPDNTDAQSHFIGWEISCFGLSKNTGPFNAGGVKQSFEVWSGDKPVIIDKFNFNGDDENFKQSYAGLQEKTVTGVMVSGPFQSEQSTPLLDSQLLANIRAIETDESVLFSTTVKGQWLITRYLGANAEQARNLMSEVWKLVRPELIHKPRVIPRIWSC